MPRVPLSDGRVLGWLAGSFAGRRCFVVGNGPSLTVADLDRIACSGDISIASNKIFLAFADTQWRPTIYTVADWCVAENNVREIRELNLLKMFPQELRSYLGPEYTQAGRAVFFRQIVPPPVPDEAYVSYFTDDIRQGVFVGETITNLNIQIAAFLGCREIYLIGVDGPLC